MKCCFRSTAIGVLKKGAARFVQTAAPMKATGGVNAGGRLSKISVGTFFL
jgi:hypothetical protein